MLKGYLKKKKKKKPKPNQTNVIVPCKLEEIFFQTKKKKKKKKRKVKSTKRQKVGHWMENDNFVQFTLPHFLSILERLNCGGPERKQLGPTTFLSLSPSQPNTIPTYFLSYFLLSFFHPP